MRPDYAKIAEDYNTGMLYRELMQKYGISASTIGRVRAKYGLAHRGRAIPCDMAEVLRDYNSGMTLKAMSKKHRKLPKTMKRILVQAGIEPVFRRGNPPKPKPHDRKRDGPVSFPVGIEYMGLFCGGAEL